MCYRAWAEGAAENAITETLSGRRLKDRGFAKQHRRHGTVCAGSKQHVGPARTFEDAM